MTAIATRDQGVASLYAKLEERVLERDQVGASGVFYDLVRAGRPLEEMLRETVRIHAPYTHLPYHQRIDNGIVRFVNNDHCLLSARASLRLRALVGAEFEFLPMAQTTWYVPTGLDPWNQLLGKMPGHYNRARRDGAPVPPPEVHLGDQEPLYLDGDIDERLNHWLTLVQRGEVVPAYRVFLGLLDDEEHRDQVLAHLAFAGLIINLRRSTSGLALRAVRDSEPASRTLGVSVVQVKVIVGAIGAFVAAVGGAFLAIDTGVAQPQSYETFLGLVWLAVVVTLGVRSIVGAALAGMAFALLPGVFQTYVPVRWGEVPAVLFGLGAISVARDPDGAVVHTGRQIRQALGALGSTISGRPPARVAGAAAPAPAASGAVPQASQPMQGVGR